MTPCKQMWEASRDNYWSGSHSLIIDIGLIAELFSAAIQRLSLRLETYMFFQRP
ncbi:MAG: hypothetical protein KDB22_04670 [Planctomycetales bacterium]|nr:hypothetical protein [Planctomycetales bacterium]